VVDQWNDAAAARFPVWGLQFVFMAIALGLLWGLAWVMDAFAALGQRQAAPTSQTSPLSVPS
jgi:hypothetical protein